VRACTVARAQSQAPLRAGDVRSVRLHCAQSAACAWGYTPSPRARLFPLFRRYCRSELDDPPLRSLVWPLSQLCAPRWGISRSPPCARQCNACPRPVHAFFALRAGVACASASAGPGPSPGVRSRGPASAHGRMRFKLGIVWSPDHPSPSREFALLVLAGPPGLLVRLGEEASRVGGWLREGETLCGWGRTARRVG
jgi:hypothetical protein